MRKSHLRPVGCTDVERDGSIALNAVTDFQILSFREVLSKSRRVTMHDYRRAALASFVIKIINIPSSLVR
jgi:hypothetical protein